MAFTSGHDDGETLELIHAAALDADAWLAVLRRLASLTGCVAGGLTAEDPSTGQGRPITHFGFDPDRVERTFDYYLPMNPLFSIAPRMQPGFVVTNGDVVPLAEFRKSEFYDGWARPQSLCSPVTLVLHRDGPMFVPLTLVRPDGAGEASEADRALLSRLAPHLMQALRTNVRLNLLETKTNLLEESLERLPAGVLLLDRGRRVIFANAAGQAALTAATLLRTRYGCLEACNPGCDERLQAEIGQALDPGNPSGGEVLVPIETEAAVSLSVLPLGGSGGTAWGAGRGSGCMVLINDCSSRSSPCLDGATAEFRLTRAEARVLGAIVDGRGLTQVAQSLGIARDTAKSHLRAIFAKTGTHRQSELIRLIQGSAAKRA